MKARRPFPAPITAPRPERLPDDAHTLVETRLPDEARKGRGAVSNRPGRFEPGDRPREDDGWQTSSREEDDLPPVATTVTIAANPSPVAPK